MAGVAGVEVRFAATRSGHAGHASPSPRPDSFAAWVRAALRGMKDAPRDERGMKPDPALWIKFPASRLPGKTSSGCERTRTADFHVANVSAADSGEPSRQVSKLSTRRRTAVNGGVRGMAAG